MPSKPRRSEKQRRTRGASHPEGGGSRRWSERPINPLDIPDDKFGKNPRDLSAAVRRSGAIAAEIKGKSRRITKTSRKRREADAIDTVRDTHAGSPEIARNKLRSRQHAPAAAGRKSGPGKRRPYPKKTRKR